MEETNFNLDNSIDSEFKVILNTVGIYFNSIVLIQQIVSFKIIEYYYHLEIT